MQVRRLLPLLMVLAGCVTAPPKKEAPPPPVDPAESVRGVFTEAYASLKEGDGDRLAQLFTEDALVFGLGPADTWSGALVGDRLRQQLLPIGLSGDAIRVDASNVIVGLDDGEQAGWAFDLPKVTTTHKAEDRVWLPRVTAHVVKLGEAWRIDALHVSLGVPDALVFAPDATKRLLPPSDVPNQRPTEADQVVGVVRRALDDYAVKVDRTSERTEFVQLGTSPAEVFIGGKAFKDAIKPQLGAIKKAGYAWKLDGNLAVKLAPGGKSGWAAAVVVQRQGTGKKQQVFPAFRFLWTVSEEDGVWNITSEHQSLAVKEELRDPANDEALKTWKQVREVVEKATAKKAAPVEAGDAGVPETKKDDGIGAW